MLSMIWDVDAMGGDVEIVDGGLVDDDTLRTAILISLFTDRRAGPDDMLPDDSGDRRGWVGDALATTEGDRIGSRLWLLKRRKQVEQTRRDGEDYCREALQWLVEDSIATALDVSAAWARSGVLAVRIGVVLPDGSNPVFTYSVSTSA